MLLSQLKQNILNRLGEPYHTVNLTDTQINLLIEEALIKYRNHHHSATNIDVYLLSVLDGIREYTLPSTINSVSNFYEINLSSLPLSLRYYKTGIYSTDMIVDMISYSVLEMYAKSLSMTMEPKYAFSFNKNTKKFIFEHTPQYDKTWGLKVSIITEDEDAYNDIWFQKYITALCMKQYAWNLLKFDSTLPGATKVNYQLMLDEAKQEIEKLDEELINEHSAPIPILYG